MFPKRLINYLKLITPIKFHHFLWEWCKLCASERVSYVKACILNIPIKNPIHILKHNFNFSKTYLILTCISKYVSIVNSKVFLKHAINYRKQFFHTWWECFKLCNYMAFYVEVYILNVPIKNPIRILKHIFNLLKTYLTSIFFLEVCFYS